MATAAELYTISNLLEQPTRQSVEAQVESKEKSGEVKLEKDKQKNILMELMEEELKKAEKKESGSFLSNIGNVLSFFNPIAGGVLSGLGTGYQAKSQKDALEALSKSGKLKQYGGTWLSDPSSSYMKDVSKMSEEISPWQTALASGFETWGTGKIGKDITGVGIGEIGKGGLKNLFGVDNFWSNLNPLGDKGIGRGGLKRITEGVKEHIDSEVISDAISGTKGKIKTGEEVLQQLFDLFESGGGNVDMDSLEDYFRNIRY